MKFKTLEDRICAIISYNSKQGDQVAIIEYKDGSVDTYNKNDLRQIIPDILIQENGDMNVSCAFSKWSMGRKHDAAAIVISFNHYPNTGSIYLHDVFEQDIDRLIIMFNKIKESIKDNVLLNEETFDNLID